MVLSTIPLGNQNIYQNYRIVHFCNAVVDKYLELFEQNNIMKNPKTTKFQTLNLMYRILLFSETSNFNNFSRNV